MKAFRGLHNQIMAFLPLLGLVGTGCTQAKLFALPTQYPVVTLQIQNYCPLIVGSGASAQYYSYQDIFLYNSQAYFNGTEYTLDTDGDGLPDTFEQTMSNMNLWDINYLYPDTPQCGYRDPVRVRLGITSTSVPGLPACETGITDSDSDGLTDCEEQLLGTEVNNTDTDGDGIPDGIEYRFGMDPLDPNDVNLEPTGDNISNYQKAKWGIPVSTFVTPSAQVFFPVYQGPNPTSGATGACATPMTFSISNISILPVTGANVLQIRTLEDPQSAGLTTRQSQILTVDVPSGVTTGSTVVVPTGFTVSTITNPTIITPGGH